MNEKIKLLAEQAGMGYGNLSTGNGDNWIVAGKPEELEKFAELIVRECLGIINKEHDEGIDRHGDYQLALYEAYREIKEHFGVEE